MSNAHGRIVTLIDMDCFYCQVEVRRNPAHRGKPLAVVQYNLWRGGGIIAVNYEARDKGVTRGMRGDEAKQKCPDIVLVTVPSVRGKADLSNYRDAGKEVVDVFNEFCDCVQRASIDEAYLDITQVVEARTQKLIESNSFITLDQVKSTFVVGFCPDDSNDEDTRKRGLTEFLEDQKYNPDTFRLAVAAALVEEMRAEVLKQTGFHCSAGISHNKVLAKLVCGIHKPRRQTVLPASCVEQLFSVLPVRKVRNLGGKFGVEVVEQLGCQTMGDLAKFSEKELQQRFDEKTGSWLYEIARGIDNDLVTPRLIPKSIGCSKNFPGRNSLVTKETVEHWMKELCGEVSERLNQDLLENKRRARLLTVSVSLDGVSTSRSGPLQSYEATRIAADSLSLISRTNQAPANSPAWKPPITMMAVSVGKFVDDQCGAIQNFFKQIPKKDTKGHEDLITEDKNESAISVLKPKINAISESLNQSASGDATQNTSTKQTGKDSATLEQFFNKSNVKSDEKELGAILEKSFSAKDVSKKTENERERPATQVKNTDSDNSKTKENSFFLTYLQKLKSESVQTAPAGFSPPKNFSPKTKPNVSSTSKRENQEMNESLAQIKEMFPNPMEVEEAVISLLPSSMQETFYSWRSHFRRELGVFSPEKPVQLNSRKNVPQKLLFPSPKKVAENQKIVKTEREPPSKPKGKIETFFQKGGRKNDVPEAEVQPSCSYQCPVSEDSNSCDAFNIVEEQASGETDRCSICNQLVLLKDFPEHFDYHAAVNLDQALNKPKSTPDAESSGHDSSLETVQPTSRSSIVVRKKRGRPPKNPERFPMGKKLKSISSFFCTKESNSAQILDKRM